MEWEHPRESCTRRVECHTLTPTFLSWKTSGCTLQRSNSQLQWNISSRWSPPDAWQLAGLRHCPHTSCTSLTNKRVVPMPITRWWALTTMSCCAENWFPVRYHVPYQSAVLSYEAFIDEASSYIKNILVPFINTALKSFSNGDLQPPYVHNQCVTCPLVIQLEQSGMSFRLP